MNRWHGTRAPQKFMGKVQGQMSYSYGRALHDPLTANRSPIKKRTGLMQN